MRVGDKVMAVEVGPKWGAETYKRNLNPTGDYFVTAVSECGALIKVHGIRGMYWGVASFRKVGTYE